MAARQEIHENGRVSAIVQWILGVSAPLVVAGIIGLVVLVLDIKQDINDLDIKIQLQTQKADYEHAGFDGRITTIERERDSERRDSRSD